MSTLSNTVESSSARYLRRHRGAVAVLLLAGTCLAMLAGGGRDGAASPRPIVNPLVHWQDSRHDWLLVADRGTHELVVYDATTGEPLQRLGRDDGLGSVDTIAALGDHLLVQDARGQPTLLGLPSLRAGTLALR
jgi:hypothetical protein